ncbi:MAG TPA: hypothetical protein VIJ94_06515 [Caulobacteraceae bacterium]
MRLIATLIIVILAGLTALFAGWPSLTPAWFGGLIHGVPGSVVAMSGLLLAFVIIAGFCGAIARNASAADREAGR